MKWKFLAQTVALITGLLGIKEIPIDTEANATSFTEEQKNALEAEFGKDFSEKVLEAMDKEIANVLGQDQNLKAIQDEIAALEAISKAEEEENANGTDKNQEEMEGSEVAKLQKIQALVAEKNEIIAKLLQEPEDDVTPQKANAMIKHKIAHSATHLFASNKSYDAFENRPWNARLRDASAKSTNFKDDANIPTLEGDMEHFVRENPEALNSLFNDYNMLPSDWARRSGVLDIVTDGYIIPGEVSQGRSKGWKPKGKYHIAAESGRVFRKKIDVEFDGYELQEIENTWIRSYNKEGSHPWKMSFVYFLLSELVKKQAQESRIAQIKGIFVQTPEGDGNAGSYINSQDGLMYYFWKNREITKKYKPFDIGRPTPENIVDYIKQMIMLMPEVERNATGNEIIIPETLMRWYRDRAGFLYQHNYNSDTGKYEYKEQYPVDFPNFKFQVLLDLTNTEFIAITASSNIEILDYDASERGKFTVQHEKRDTVIFADWREGIRIKLIGTKIAENDPREFEVQKVWTNNVPIFDPSTTIPAFDDGSGILNMHFPSVKIDSEFRTDITEIEGELAPGMIVRVVGNKHLQTVKNLVKGGKLELVSNYPLNTDGEIVMLVLPNGNLKEIKRTTEAPVLSLDKTFDTDVVDANVGSSFVYNGEESTSLTQIVSGVEGKSIKIYGTDLEDVTVTVSKTGNIDIATNAVLAKSTDFIELIFISGTWYELSRTITA